MVVERLRRVALVGSFDLRAHGEQVDPQSDGQPSGGKNVGDGAARVPHVELVDAEAAEEEP